MKRKTVATLTLILLTVLLDLRLSQVFPLRVGPGFDDVSIDWTQYHDYGNLTRILLQMNRTYSNVASVFSIGKSYLGREIWAVRLTDESSRALKTESLILELGSDLLGDDEDEAEDLIWIFLDWGNVDGC